MLHDSHWTSKGTKWTDEDRIKRKKRNAIAKTVGVVVYAELKRNPNLSWEKLEEYTGTKVRRFVINSSPTTTLEEAFDIAEYLNLSIDRLLHPTEEDRLIFTLLDKKELY